MFLCRRARISLYLFLITVHSRDAKKSPVGPSSLLEALNITSKENKIKSEPSSHGVKNGRFPPGFSYSSQCLPRKGVVFLGGPCGVMPATSCVGFNCASGIGFPISTVCCSWVSCREGNQLSRRINAAKRFDITSLPAHPFALSAKIRRRKPFKGKRRRKHKHSKPSDYHHQSTKEEPEIDVELKLNDEPKAEEQDDLPVVQPQAVFGQTLHHRPWLPYMHRPLNPFHMRYHPHFFPHYMHRDVGFQLPSYWRFQGYFPHFMRMRSPWAMNPSDFGNIYRYPEYQYRDVQFAEIKNPFSQSRPPFRNFNDFNSDVELLDRPQKPHERLMHSKNLINNDNEHNRFHEEDRKIVDDSEDSMETFKWNKYNQREDENHKNTNLGTREEQDVLHFSPTEKEDEEINYPEYKNEFNTDHFWPSTEKRQGTIYNQFSVHKPEKEEHAIFR